MIRLATVAACALALAGCANPFAATQATVSPVAAPATSPAAAASVPSVPVSASSLPKLLTSGLTLTGNPQADIQTAIADLNSFAGGDLKLAISIASKANPPDTSAEICWERLSNDLTLVGNIPANMGLATAIQELFFLQNEIPRIKSDCGVIAGRLQTGLLFP